MLEIRNISCKRCQTRKIKCTRNDPCSNCNNAGVICDYPRADARKKPVSHKYLSALEERLSWYESFIKKLQESTETERSRLLASVSMDDHLPQQRKVDQLSAGDEAQSLTCSNTASLNSNSAGTLQYDGPTSIFTAGENRVEQVPASIRSHKDPSIWKDMRLAAAMGIDDHIVKESLSLFFEFQYPQHMFVYREAFLEDYFGQAHGGKYWSLPLVYAIGSLGAIHSDNRNIRKAAGLMAKCACEIIISNELDRARPTTIQALLCLAFHELGQGSSNKGWLLSGMAFRMGQTLGFQQDPSNWKTQDWTIASEYDIEIRRRIYWGCYVADKYVSLFLGRIVYLVEMEATVSPTVRLPDYPDDHDWFGLEGLAPARNSGEQRRPELTSTLKQCITIANIFQDAMCNIFATRNRQNDPDALVGRLSSLNFRLSQWYKDLPESLQWPVNIPTRIQLSTHLVNLHLFYRSVCMSLNYHFVKPSPGFLKSETSELICRESSNAVVAIVRQIRQDSGFRGAPLILVYGLVMAATILANVSSSSKIADGRGNSQLKFLLKALAECSEIYGLAREAHTRLVSKIHEQDRLAQRGAVSTSGTNSALDKGKMALEANGSGDTTDSAMCANDLDQFEAIGGPSNLEMCFSEEFPATDQGDWQDLELMTDALDDFYGWFSLGTN